MAARKRRKPKTIPLSPGSERTALRLAMALAWDELDYANQLKLKGRAKRVLEQLRRIV